MEPLNSISNPHISNSFTQPLQQSWPLPSQPRPIVIIGAGGIVRDAHLPAYRLANFQVAGVYDRDLSRAETMGQEWGIPVMPNLAAAVDVKNAIFDLAVPPQSHIEVLSSLPHG